MLDTEGEVAFVSVFKSLTKIVSKDFRPYRHCPVNFIPKNKIWLSICFL